MGGCIPNPYSIEIFPFSWILNPENALGEVVHVQQLLLAVGKLASLI